VSKFKTYGPARTDGLALVSLSETDRPFRAVWPVLIRQLLGGKRWSLSLIQYRTPRLEQARVSETEATALHDAPHPSDMRYSVPEIIDALRESGRYGTGRRLDIASVIRAHAKGSP